MQKSTRWIVRIYHQQPARIKNSEFPVLMQQPAPISVTQNFTALENQEYNHDKATGNAEKNLRLFFVKLDIYINFGWVPTHYNITNST